MAAVDLVLENPYVFINAVDYSAQVEKVTITYDADAVENTAGSAAGTHTFMGGLKNWSMEFELKQDFSASGFDEKLFALVGTTMTVEVRPAQGARSTSNPGYNGTALLTSFPPFGTGIGELVKTTVKFMPAGALSRDTA